MNSVACWDQHAEVPRGFGFPRHNRWLSVGLRELDQGLRLEPQGELHQLVLLQGPGCYSTIIRHGLMESPGTAWIEVTGLIFGALLGA